jgi:hypothetical protein
MASRFTRGDVLADGAVRFGQYELDAPYDVPGHGRFLEHPHGCWPLTGGSFKVVIGNIYENPELLPKP